DADDDQTDLERRARAPYQAVEDVVAAAGGTQERLRRLGIPRHVAEADARDGEAALRRREHGAPEDRLRRVLVVGLGRGAEPKVAQAVPADVRYDGREHRREHEEQHDEEADDGERVPSETLERLGIAPATYFRPYGLACFGDALVSRVRHHSYLIRGSMTP